MKSNEDNIVEEQERALNIAMDAMRDARQKLANIQGLEKSVLGDINTLVECFKVDGHMDALVRDIFAKNEQRLKDLDDAGSI